VVKTLCELNGAKEILKYIMGVAHWNEWRETRLVWESRILTRDGQIYCQLRMPLFFRMKEFHLFVIVYIGLCFMVSSLLNSGAFWRIKILTRCTLTIQPLLPKSHTKETAQNRPTSWYISKSLAESIVFLI
jgi:hypothetical protein